MKKNKCKQLVDPENEVLRLPATSQDILNLARKGDDQILSFDDYPKHTRAVSVLNAINRLDDIKVEREAPRRGFDEKFVVSDTIADSIYQDSGFEVAEIKLDLKTNKATGEPVFYARTKTRGGDVDSFTIKGEDAKELLKALREAANDK